MMSSAFSMPFLAFGSDFRMAGMVLLMVAFACFARWSLRMDCGASVCEGSSLPISKILDVCLLEAVTQPENPITSSI